MVESYGGLVQLVLPSCAVVHLYNLLVRLTFCFVWTCFRHLAAEERSAEQKKAGVQQPKLDFSLKEGQTLNLTIAGGGTGASTRRNRPPRPAASDEGGRLVTIIFFI